MDINEGRIIKNTDNTIKVKLKEGEIEEFEHTGWKDDYNTPKEGLTVSIIDENTLMSTSTCNQMHENKKHMIEKYYDRNNYEKINEDMLGCTLAGKKESGLAILFLIVSLVFFYFSIQFDPLNLVAFFIFIFLSFRLFQEKSAIQIQCNLDNNHVEVTSKGKEIEIAKIEKNTIEPK